MQLRSVAAATAWARCFARWRCSRRATANLHVVVFGPGAHDDELRLHAAALGVSPIVTFLGERDDERRVMRAANAGWVVSGGDSGAFACLDFMAMRVPVIAERSPLTQHYVADGITGMLLSPGDPSHTASARRGVSHRRREARRDGQRRPHARAARLRRDAR